MERATSIMPMIGIMPQISYTKGRYIWWVEIQKYASRSGSRPQSIRYSDRRSLQYVWQSVGWRFHPDVECNEIPCNPWGCASISHNHNIASPSSTIMSRNNKWAVWTAMFSLKHDCNNGWEDGDYYHDGVFAHVT